MTNIQISSCYVRGGSLCCSCESNICAMQVVLSDVWRLDSVWLVLHLLTSTLIFYNGLLAGEQSKLYAGYPPLVRVTRPQGVDRCVSYQIKVICSADMLLVVYY